MEKEATGTVASVKKQWWLKVNTKPIRRHSTDGAVFPYIISVHYTVNDRIYTKRKWIHAGRPVPQAGSTVTVLYDADKPQSAKLMIL